MTAVSQERLLPQPQSKSLPTVQSSHPDIVATKTTSTSRAPPKTKGAKSRQDVPLADFTSKAATLSLIRRTLIPDSSQNSDARSTPRPIEGILPPLTSSNEIDLQLYAIVAIVVKDFVNTWYSKITPDHTFIDEIIQIIAHCSRALEQRIRHTDVAALILDELSLLLENHVTAYRTATSSLAQQSYGVHPRTTYHSLNPHPALRPVAVTDGPTGVSASPVDETAYRQLLISGTLAILLPTEDLQNAPLRILVGDIIADLIVGQAVAEKVCEGWFIHSAITKAVAASKQQVKPRLSREGLRHNTKTKLEEFGLLNTHHEAEPNQSDDALGTTLWFWRITQWMYLFITAAWFVMQGLFSARHLPKRFRPPPSSSGSLKISPTQPITKTSDQSPRPVLTYGVSNFVSTLIRLQDRMPWLGSTIAFCQHVLLAGSGRLAATNSVLDRFLHHTLTSHVFAPNVVVSVLIGFRVAIFPNNSLGPSAPPPPSAEERLEIRRQAAKAILSLVPPLIARTYFDSSDEEELVRCIEEDVLDVFGDKYMNKHLVYGILELLLVRLVPELQEAGVGDLLAERAVSWGEIESEAAADVAVQDILGKEGETVLDPVMEQVKIETEK